MHKTTFEELAQFEADSPLLGFNYGTIVKLVEIRSGIG